MKDEYHELPEEPSAGTYGPCHFGSLFFNYMSKPMYLANKLQKEGKSLKDVDIYKIPKERSADTIYDQFWARYQQTKSIFRSQYHVMRRLIPCQVFLLFLYQITQYSGPLCLNALLEFYADPAAPSYRGYVITTVLMCLLIFRSLMINHGNDYVNMEVTSTYASMYTAVYMRLLHIAESTKGTIGAGRIINFFTTDATFIADVLNMVNNIWVAPLHLILSVTLLYFQVEWCALIGVGMILVMCFLQSLVMGAFIKNRFANQRETDKRTKLLQEFLEGIRIIKYYAWERFAHAKVGAVRQREIKEMSTALYLRTLYEFLAVLLPVLTMLTVFSVYATFVGDLTVAKVFTVISLFRVLQMPLWTFVTALILFAQAKASIQRVSKFFALSEASAAARTERSAELPAGKIVIQDGSFAWETPESRKACEEFSTLLTARFGPAKPAGGAATKPAVKGKDGNDKAKEKKKQEEEDKDKTPEAKQELQKNYVTLKDINFSIEPGNVVAIVGVVGSGKSSLANAIIGEMMTMSGSAKFNGSLAFIAQNAWIMNGTLRDNILMDKPYDKEKYDKVIKICELDEDLGKFTQGDLTEIGSKGINLSGGQKQRVAIARSVYSDADIYVIDDCLSALDPSVGKCVFNNVIMGALAGKTRVFVTHSMSFLKDFEKIVVMKEGRIVSQGSYAELAQNSAEFKYLTTLDRGKKKGQPIATTETSAPAEAKLTAEIVSPIEEEKKAPSDVELEETDKEDAKHKSKSLDKGKLIEEEKKESGRVKWTNYVLLFKASGILITSLCLVAFIIEQAGSIVLDWWVGMWAANVYEKPNKFYIWRYASLALLEGVIILIRGSLYIRFIIALAKNTQMRMLWAILRAPLQWFDKTPVGRIMNRACKDQSDVDNDLVWLVQACLRTVILLSASVVLVGVVTYYFFAIIVVMLALYIYYYSFAIQAARDSRRIESVAKSPIFVQYEETLDGLSTIRAYNYDSMFSKRMVKNVNHCMNAYFMTTRCVRWLNLRVDALSAIVVAGAFYLATYARNSSSGTSSNMIGLSLSQSLNVVNMIAILLMFFGMLETKMNSVERVFEYINENPKEKDYDEPKPASEDWPSQGEIAINNMCLRYRHDLPFVIKGLNVKIAAKEKVGIAGRTGSGKSTLTLGLLRIMEPIDPANSDLEQNDFELTPCKNAIVIDGQDVTGIGLHVLRKNVAIIPQDPVLFSGTIRSNLDPFSAARMDRDREMISVIYKVKLIDKIWRKMVEKPAEKEKAKKPAGDVPTPKDTKEEPLLSLTLDKALSASLVVSIPSENELTKKQMEDVLGYEVQEKGSNFSAGERQLLCIARAILRHPKILLMDEATASIDEATDQDIQMMIKREFKDSTVITIAHRVKTIIEYDKILVLKDGEMVEFGPPIELLGKENGIFRDMVLRHGEAALESMKRLALRRKSTD